ncbi:YopX family protein [Lysinibacillus fusiformis]|uniref:YopX family protein n=1 Tax=Lysinibacillus fusiformis TaxID=28031 RepID=UPI001881D930|nr:YopX family protein [Lysinibacillus fusiformis]MBD8522371.1 hypothetical protein [Lysinibacillus fusiformis]
MSREIKFRAWDKTYNFMSYKVLVGNTDTTDENYTAHCIWVDPEKVDYKREPGWMNFDELSDVVLMQYTGLKDKNGKEIFEGDILTDHGDEGPLYIEYSTVHAAFVFVDKFDPSGTTVYTTTCISYGGFEIIGNIYENPELLEATA